VLERLGGLDAQAGASAGLAAVVEELRRLDAGDAHALTRAELLALQDPRLDGVAVVGEMELRGPRQALGALLPEHARNALRVRGRGEHERREDGSENCKVGGVSHSF
jgi:hypothetical protein